MNDDDLKDIIQDEGLRRLPSYFSNKVLQSTKLIDRKREKRRWFMLCALMALLVLMVIFAPYLTINFLDYSFVIPAYLVQVLCFIVFSVFAYHMRDLSMLLKEKHKLDDCGTKNSSSL